MKRKYNKRSWAVSANSLTVMLLGTLLILLQLGYIAFDIFSGSQEEQFYAVQLYRSCFDYILLEAVLLVGGAFLFDMVEKDTANAFHF